MESSQPPRPGTTEGPPPGRFRAWQAACWLPVAAAAGVAIGWAAVVAERYYAPVVVFPILVGVVLGGFLVLLMRLARVGHRPTLAAGTLLAIVLAVAGEHYFAFRQDQPRLTQEEHKRAMVRAIEQACREAGYEVPESIPPPPADFVGYTSWRANQKGAWLGRLWLRGSVFWLLSALDAVLLGLACFLLVAATAKLPYCNRCQRWYHTIRSGKIAPSTAGRLAAMAGVELAAEVRFARYRMTACPGGCGATGLALFWEQPDGSFSSGYVWLDASGRRDATSVLDEGRGR